MFSHFWATNTYRTPDSENSAWCAQRQGAWRTPCRRTVGIMSVVSETPKPGDFSMDIVSQADWICKVYANLRRTPKFCQLPTEDLKLLSKMQVKVTSFPKIPKFHRSLQFLTVHLSLWPWLGLGTCNSVVKCSNNFCALTLVSSTCFKPQEVFQYQIDFQISFRPNEAKQI